MAEDDGNEQTQNTVLALRQYGFRQNDRWVRWDVLRLGRSHF